ncbi:hypothetical protein B4U79_17812 [Dinothrombium tinctorium]|uniref:PIN domain-containing protein n=1 Tax=Dinothrombium tinctorium TaxID=1965070 RepID=A0A443QYH8_9ACAR|nr:hypothetical protein B4U79_17812 [Dinothrombium tinctorium]
MEDVDMVDVENEISKNESCSPLKLGERQFLKAKRRRVSHCNNREESGQKLAFSANWVVVIDTNIFVQHLSALKSFVAQQIRCERNNVQLVVPLVVIQEIDGLKRGNNSSVQKIAEFINEQLEAKVILTSDVSLIKALSDEQDDCDDNRDENISAYNNDDVILQKCLRLRRIKKLKSSRIILLTDDLNLRNKALAVDLCSYSWKKFKCEFMDVSQPNNILKKSSNERQDIPVSNLNTKRKASSELIEFQPLKQQAIPMETLPAFESKAMQRTKPIKNYEMSPISRNSLKLNGDWLSVKYEAEKVLLKFIETSLKEVYGDQLWDKMFDINIENASLFDILRLLDKGWIGVFSDYFERDKSVKDLVEELIREWKNESDRSKLRTLVISLVNKLPLNGYCDVNKTDKRLKNA